MTWYVEDGIGERRAMRIEQGRILAARLHWPGWLTAGQVDDARLVSTGKGSSRGIARFANGEEALVDHLPRNISEGSVIRLEITRSAMGERSRRKPAQARPSKLAIQMPDLAGCLGLEAEEIQFVRRFPDCERDGDGWDTLIGDALDRKIDFAGGSLLLDVTPAMTVIDVDGNLPPSELALAAVPAIADTLQRLDIGGVVGIDFPTLERKDDRRAVDHAIADALHGWPHESTAMNGFGFVQLVARLSRPSLLDLANRARTGLLARQLLRRAENVSAPGAVLISCHPAIKNAFKSDWLDQLSRRTGRLIRIESNPGLALEGGFAQTASL